MSLLLLFHGAAVTAKPIAAETKIAGGGAFIGPDWKDLQHAGPRAASEQFSEQPILIESKGRPEQFPVTPPVEPVQATTALPGVQNMANPAGQPLQAAQAQADALAARLLAKVAARVAADALTNAQSQELTDAMTDDDAYMLMALALEVMA